MSTGSLYLIWNTVETWYSNLIGNLGIVQARWSWSGHYDAGKNILAFAYTAQFKEPGWHYLDTESGRHSSDATFVMLAFPSGKYYSTIIEAMGVDLPTKIMFQLEPPREGITAMEDGHGRGLLGRPFPEGADG